MKKTTLWHLFFISILLLLSARFLIAGWDRILRNSNSADGDQGAYLQLGLDVREHGMLTDGKRNPLYPVLLSSFAEREWDYFTWAKILNLAVGLVTVWAVYLVGHRLFNPATGLLAAFWLSINMEFVLHSTFALAEALLILTTLLAWFAMVRALQQPAQLKYWLAGGGLAGLAYLAKGTGPLIAVCFVITATLLYGLSLWRKQMIWLFIAGFGAVSLPLWVYNWLAFGSPLFNSAINNVMWMDDATEKYVTDPSALPTVASYWQNKSLGEAWNRLWHGLLTMRYFFARLLWPTRSLAFDRFFQVGGIDLIAALLSVLLILFWRPLWPVIKRHRESLLLTGVLVAIFYVLFGWYLAISPFPIRFLLPLAPMLFLLISAGLVGLVRAVFVTEARMPRWAKGVAGAVTLLLLLPATGWFTVTGWLMFEEVRQDAFAADAEFNTYTEQALRWVELGHPADEPLTVMWGPTHMLPVWRHSDRLNLLRTPVANAESARELQAFMAANRVAYVIVDSEMVDRMDSEEAAKWGITHREDRYLDIHNFPETWGLGFINPDLPCQWCVFRRLSAPPAIERTTYMLGDSIDLFGYNLDASRFQPGGQMVVTLYWAAVQPIQTDFTVFTQLLGPDFQLHGQMDRPPILPTSRWQPQQNYVDKFILDITPTAPPGDYTLLVGLYNPQTGERLPVTQESEPVQDNAIPLLQLPLNAGESLQ